MEDCLKFHGVIVGKLLNQNGWYYIIGAQICCEGWWRVCIIFKSCLSSLLHWAHSRNQRYHSLQLRMTWTPYQEMNIVKFATFAIKLIKKNHNMVELKIRPYRRNSIAYMHIIIYLHELKSCKFSHSNHNDQERLKRQTYSLTQTQTNHIQVHRCANRNIDKGGPKHSKIIKIEIYIYIYIYSNFSTFFYSYMYFPHRLKVSSTPNFHDFHNISHHYQSVIDCYFEYNKFHHHVFVLHVPIHIGV